MGARPRAGGVVTAFVPEWFRGRRVLVTGHTGFKGAWLAAWLRDAGAEVTGYALAPEAGRPSLFTMAGLAEGIRSIIGDVRDAAALGFALDAARPEIILHLAAQSLVRRSYTTPVETFSTNVVGTAQLLELVRGREGVRAVVIVTSDKCYENQGLARGYVESDPMGGHDPYSASKGCQELVTASFRRAFLADAGVAVASARAGNVIGGGDWAEDRLMVDLVLAAAAGRPATIRNPDAVRPWQFVLEPLRGYLMLARALVDRGQAMATAWNFGPDAGDAVPVRDVVARVSAAWPLVRASFAPPAVAPHEAHLLMLDNGKAARDLGWSPALTLDETIALTVDWYRTVAEEPAAAAAMVRTQLEAYSRRVRGAAGAASPTRQGSQGHR